ncbi:2496_t:CDS:2 [Dentiscutata erythropus]|uniref:2496_t:CDS:1 n=1 Tax=Dentiscutata erythropus TaxID=1348616 RepID=A0A9N9HLW2_9GLOM|nr:2496_t:CDS:2 [Dentiscutata erythropus]
MASEGSVAGLVKGLLGRSEFLMDSSISKAYKKHLSKAHAMFEAIGSVVAREHKRRDLGDPTKGNSIHFLVEES